MTLFIWLWKKITLITLEETIFKNFSLVLSDLNIPIKFSLDWWPNINDNFNNEPK